MVFVSLFSMSKAQGEENSKNCEKHKEFHFHLHYNAIDRDKVYFIYTPLSKPDIEYPGYQEHLRRYLEYDDEYSKIYRRCSY